MALAKQLIQFFFGASDQDKNKKGVNLSDLVLAKNVIQVHAGSHEKRGGFYQAAQSYDAPTSITGESITSPDGIQVLIRDSATDSAFARSSDATHNQTQGSSLRLMTKWPVRFPAKAAAEQMSPMAKQAGDYYVWLSTEGTLRVAKRSSNTETELITSNTVSSERIKSFAVIDNAAFDAAHLWIYWIDWSTKDSQQNRDWVRAASVSHDLHTWNFYTVSAGTASNLILTSISASVTADNFVTLGVLGCHPGNGGPDDYTNFIGFRAACEHIDSYFNAIKVDNTGVDRWNAPTTRSSSVPGWTGSGVCSLTAKTTAAYHAGHCYFAFWTNDATDVNAANLVIVDVDEEAATQTWTIAETVTNAGYTTTTEGYPLFLGSVTGHETAGGAILAAQFRVYYYPASGVFADPLAAGGCYPDRIYTCGYLWTAGGAATKAWTARAAWLAQGWFAADDGTELLITGWQDNDGVQMPYHMRRLDSGAILGQFARGEAAYPGGCGTATAQIERHIADIQQPMANAITLNPSSRQLLVGLTSANINQSTDIANVTVTRVNFSQPATFRSFALAPGPTPTIVSGWQHLCEAGPLSDPSGVRAYWGVGSS